MAKVKQFIDVAANTYDALEIYKLLGDELEQDFLKKEAAITQTPNAVLYNGDALPILESSKDPGTPRKINWGVVGVTGGLVTSIGGVAIGASGAPDQDIWYNIIGDTGSILPNSPTTTLNIVGSGLITTDATSNTITIDSPILDIFKTINADTGSITAVGISDYLNIIGNGTVTTSISGNTLTITGIGDGTGTTQNLWETFIADTGNVTATSPNDTLTIVGSGTITTSIVGTTLTINGTGTPDQDLFYTITADTGSVSASSPTDTLNFVGDGDVTTSISGNTVTIFGTSTPGTTQNLWQTIAGDTGSTTATSPTQTLYIQGAGHITTDMDGNVMTITGTDQNLFYTISANSGSVNASDPFDYLNVVGTGAVNTSISGNTLTIHASAQDCLTGLVCTKYIVSVTGPSTVEYSPCETPNTKEQIELLQPITCGTAASYSGGVSFPTTQTVNLGTATGETTLSANALDVPDRFIVRYNGAIVIDTGYRGNATTFGLGGAQRFSFNNSLTGKVDTVTGLTYPLDPNPGIIESDGYPVVNDPGTTTASFTKNLINVKQATVEVWAPMSGTAWTFTLGCPGGTTPPSEDNTVELWSATPPTIISGVGTVTATDDCQPLEFYTKIEIDELIQGGGGTQNIWYTIAADTGQTSASSPTTVLEVSGANGITTEMVGNNLIITGAGNATTIITSPVSGLSANGGDSSNDDTIVLLQDDSRLNTGTPNSLSEIGFYQIIPGEQQKVTIGNFPGWYLFVNNAFQEEIHPFDTVDFRGTGLANVTYSSATHSVIIDATERFPLYTHIPDAFVAYGTNLYSYDISEGTSRELTGAPTAEYHKATTFAQDGAIFTVQGNTVFKYDIATDTTVGSLTLPVGIMALINDPDTIYCYVITAGRAYYFIKSSFSQYLDYGDTIVSYGTGLSVELVWDDSGDKYIFIYSDENDRLYYKKVMATDLSNETDPFTNGASAYDRIKIGIYPGFGGGPMGVFGVDNYIDTPYPSGHFQDWIDDGSGNWGIIRINDIFNNPSGHDYDTNANDYIKLVDRVSVSYPLSSVPTGYAIVEAYDGSTVNPGPGWDGGVYVDSGGNPATTSGAYEQAVEMYNPRCMHVSEWRSLGVNLDVGVDVIVGGQGEVLFHGYQDDPKQFFKRSVQQVSSNGYQSVNITSDITWVYYDATHTGGGVGNPTDPVVVSYLDLNVDNVQVEQGITTLDLMSSDSVTVSYAGTGGKVQFDVTFPETYLWEDNTTYINPVDINQEVRIGSTSGTGTDKLTVNGSTRLDDVLVTADLEVNGAILDSNGLPGTSGQILSSTVTGTSWIDAPTGGGGGESEWTLSGTLLYPNTHLTTKVLIGQNAENDPYTEALLQVAGKSFFSDDVIVSGLSPTLVLSNYNDTMLAFGYDDIDEMSISLSNYGYGQVADSTSKMISFAYDGVLFHTTIESQLKIAQGLYDSSGNTGTNGQILSSTGSSVVWIDHVTYELKWTDAGTYLVAVDPRNIEIHNDNPSLTLRDNVGGSSYISFVHGGAAQSFDIIYNGTTIMQYLDVPNTFTFNYDIVSAGNTYINGILYDSNGNPGTLGQVLSSTVTGTEWVTNNATYDTDAIHVNVANEFSVITEKTSLADNDWLLLEDSAAGFSKKKVRAANLPGAGGGISSAYAGFTDGTNSISADGSDTVRLMTGDGLVVITLVDNDPTYGDYIDFSLSTNVALDSWVSDNFEPKDPAIQTHITDVLTNPHNVTKAQVGLDLVPNLDTTNAVANQHTHSNYALLQTYNQTNANLADAVNKKHAHTNLALLETYTQTEADLSDAVSKKHTQGTDSTLDFGGVYEVSALELHDHLIDYTNPHQVTKAQVGLGNVPNIDTSTAVAQTHTHTNRGLLETYDQLNDDIADAVLKKHGHTNLALLDTYTQSEADLADAVSKKHSQNTDDYLDFGGANEISAVDINSHIDSTSNPHSVTKTQVGLGLVPNLDTTNAVNWAHEHTNLGLLETYTQTETDLADAVIKKHSHTNLTDLNKITTNIANALVAASTPSTTNPFVTVDDLADLGGGDMTKAVYDTNDNGKVDSAENADTVNNLTVLTAVPAGAVFTDTIYTHPSYSEIDIDTSLAQVIDTMTIINGHINGFTLRNLTPSDIGAQVAGSYDNYVSWGLYVNDTTHGDIISGEIVNFTSGDSIVVGYDESGTQANNIKISHATSSYSMTALTGASVISKLDFDTTGHITSVTTRNLTLLNLGYTGATNANYYVHPTHTGLDIDLDTGPLTGAFVISDLDFNVTVDTLGHVTDAVASYNTRELTLLNLGYTGATNANYITDNAQLTNGAGYLTAANTTVGVDQTLTTTNAQVISNITLVDGVVTSNITTRNLTLANLGYTGDTDANNYVHPTGDGNLHVPANGTTNAGKVLTAGAVAGTYTWEINSSGVTDHTLLSNIGTYTHTEIDTHIDTTDVHFTMGAISITESQISDFGTYDNYISWTLRDNDLISYTVTSNDVVTFKSGTGISVLFTADDEMTITSTVTLASLGFTGDTNANYYTHPTYAGDDFSVDTGALTGAVVVSDIDINVTTDTLGHVTDANGVVSTRTLTLANLGYTGATNANYYVHPTYAGDDIDLDTGALTGAVVISDLDFNVTTDASGHVTDANASFATRSITYSDVGAAAASHTHSYDNYNGWDLYTDATSRGRITTGETVDFIGGTDISISYSTTNNNSLTFNHTDYTETDIAANSGATVVSTVTVVNGHISGHTTRTLTLANLGYTGATNANYYVHPTTAGNIHIPSGGATSQILQYAGSSGTAQWYTPPWTTNTGTVTSIATNYGIAGGTITTSGTLNLSFTTGLTSVGSTTIGTDDRIPVHVSGTTYAQNYILAASLRGYMRGDGGSFGGSDSTIFFKSSYPYYFKIEATSTPGLYFKYGGTSGSFTTANCWLDSSERLHAANFMLSSSREVKKDIQSITNLERFDNIDIIQFVYKNDESNGVRYGVIAEDTEKFAPEVVSVDPNGDISVAYIDLLLAKIARLEERLNKVENDTSST